MQQTGTKDRLLILDGMAGTLNACGRTIVFSYDTCTSGLEKMYTIAKKPSDVVKNLLVSQKCLLKSKESAQLIAKISIDEYKLNELYREFGRKSMDASDSDDPSASKEMEHLLADIKQCRSKIDQLKEKVVKLEGQETAALLLEKEIRAYVQRSSKKAKKYKQQGEQEIVEVVRRAIDGAVAHGAFASESDRITFETIAKDLLDQEMDIRILAAAELGKMICVAAIDVLKVALSFNDPRLTTQIINSLITIGDIRAIPIFYEQLTNPHYRVRVEALLGISRLTDEEEVVATLLDALKDGHPEVRVTAVTLLGWRKAFDAVPALIECKNDKDECMKTSLISALTHIGDRAALPALVDLLGDKSRGIKEKALDAIKELSGEEVTFDLKTKGKKLKHAMEELKLKLGKTGISHTSIKNVGRSTSKVSRRKDPSQDISVKQVKKAARGVATSTAPAPKRKRVQRVVVSKEKLTRMVKPQLLSMCGDLNITCDISETKQQIIAKILKGQRVKRK
ncbi:MAG: HEAT repeat domain-containing protein [Thermodesulfobacteriota bacterium]